MQTQKVNNYLQTINDMGHDTSISVTEWANCEGCDVAIEAKDRSITFSVTDSELKCILHMWLESQLDIKEL